MLKQIVQWIDKLNEWVGRTVSWLIVLMVFTTFLVTVLRYGFSLGWVWLRESYVWMHGIVFMVAPGYTRRHDGHVRIDLVYGAASLRTRAWINLFGILLLLLPALTVTWWTAFSYVLLSWERLETFINLDAWNGLTDDQKAIVTNYAYSTTSVMLSELQARSGPVLQQFINEHGVEIRRLTNEQVAKIGEVCGEVISELVAADPMTKKVFESMNNFLTEQIAYSGTTEQDFFRARSLEYKWPS